MEDHATGTDKVQLTREIELVEKILAFAENPETLREADELTLELMKTQKTNTFSSVDINEYLGYLGDRERYRADNKLKEMKEAKEGAAEFLQQTLGDLKRAKEILESG